jgi:hypothetical protein
MLYCSRCQKMVDFNSVSVSGPTRAYTLDVDGPVDPTIIRSSSKTVNVCKICGSNDLHASKQASQANQQKLAKAHSKESIAWKVVGVFSLVGGIVFGVAMSNTDFGFIGGFLLMSIFIGFMGAIGIGTTDWG